MNIYKLMFILEVEDWLLKKIARLITKFIYRKGEIGVYH